MKEAFYKNNTPVVYLFALLRLAGKCTNIYNACRTIVRRIKPLVLRRFRCRCGLCKISAVVAYKRSRCRLEKFQANNYRFPHWKRLYHLPMEISGNSPRNFWSNGIKSAHGLGRTYRKAVFLTRLSDKAIYGVPTKTESLLDVVLA